MINNWIILGLGNPGEKYSDTRHNVPWWMLDILHKEFSVYKKYQKNEKNYTEIRLDLKGYSIYLIYPTTFVNNSGLALVELLNKEKFTLDKTIIISDDIHLEEGRLRIRRNGSSGGHNGLKSIIKTQQDIIDKMAKSLKIKSEENEKMKEILQKIRDKNI